MLHQIDDGRRASPLVMRGMVDGWPARAWTPESLALGPLGGTQTSFRFHRRAASGIVRESDGSAALLSLMCWHLHAKAQNHTHTCALSHTHAHTPHTHRTL